MGFLTQKTMTSTLFTDEAGTEMQVYFTKASTLIIRLSDSSTDALLDYTLDRHDLETLISELQERLNEIDIF